MTFRFSKSWLPNGIQTLSGAELLLLATDTAFSSDAENAGDLAGTEVGPRVACTGAPHREETGWQLGLDAIGSTTLTAPAVSYYLCVAGDDDDDTLIVGGADAAIPAGIWAPSFDDGVMFLSFESREGIVAVVAGDNTEIDDSDPLRPVINVLAAGTPAEADIPIARGGRVDVDVVDGKFSHHNFVFTTDVDDEDKVAIAVVHDIELADESERLTFKSADGAEPPSIVWIDETPTSAEWRLSDLFVEIIAAASGSGTIDLTTATLGHPFTSTATVDGDTLESDPIDATFPIGSGDGYAGVSALIQALLDPFLDLGAVLDMGSGTVTSPTSGTGSVLSFDPDQEEIPVDAGTLDLNTLLVPVNGWLGRVYGGADGENGGLDADQWFDPDDYQFIGSGDLGTHMHPNDAQANQRAAVLAPVSATNNGGSAKLTAIVWPVRDGFIHVSVRDAAMWAGTPPEWLNDMNERLAYATVNGLDAGKIPELP